MGYKVLFVSSKFTKVTPDEPDCPVEKLVKRYAQCLIDNDYEVISGNSDFDLQEKSAGVDAIIIVGDGRSFVSTLMAMHLKVSVLYYYLCTKPEYQTKAMIPMPLDEDEPGIDRFLEQVHAVIDINFAA